MLYQTLLASLLVVAPATAAPFCSRSLNSTATSDPVLPVQTPNTLPVLSSSVSLRIIALGVGTQNYTCASTPNDANSAPVSLGARADLYDVTNLFSNTPSDIPTMTKSALLANSGLGNNHVGQHFFTDVGSTLTPTFDLDGNDPPYFLSATKENTEGAPVAAYTGLDNEGAVPWLFLNSDSSGLSSGVSEVYRVETAGGLQPSTCADKSGDFQVPYSAEYWFYG